MPAPLEAIADVVRACHPLPYVVTSGQPLERHFTGLQAAGVGTVLDLRDPMEPRPFDEEAVVTGLGMAYVNIPLGTGTLTDETAERILHVLGTPKRDWLFVHYGTSSRAGGALLPYLLVDAGMAEEEAVTEAMRIALRTTEYLDWAFDYVRRHHS